MTGLPSPDLEQTQIALEKLATAFDALISHGPDENRFSHYRSDVKQSSRWATEDVSDPLGLVLDAVLLRTDAARVHLQAISTLYRDPWPSVAVGALTRALIETSHGATWILQAPDGKARLARGLAQLAHEAGETAKATALRNDPRPGFAEHEAKQLEIAEENKRAFSRMRRELGVAQEPRASASQLFRDLTQDHPGTAVFGPLYFAELSALVHGTDLGLRSHLIQDRASRWREEPSASHSHAAICVHAISHLGSILANYFAWNGAYFESQVQRTLAVITAAAQPLLAAMRTQTRSFQRPPP